MGEPRSKAEVRSKAELRSEGDAGMVTFVG